MNGVPLPHAHTSSFGWSGLLHHAHLSLQTDPSETENVEPLQQSVEDPGDDPQSQGEESHPAPHFWDIFLYPISPEFSKGTRVLGP